MNIILQTVHTCYAICIIFFISQTKHTYNVMNESKLIIFSTWEFLYFLHSTQRTNYSDVFLFAAAGRLNKVRFNRFKCSHLASPGLSSAGLNFFIKILSFMIKKHFIKKTIRYDWVCLIETLALLLTRCPRTNSKVQIPCTLTTGSDIFEKKNLWTQVFLFSSSNRLEIKRKNTSTLTL